MKKIYVLCLILCAFIGLNAQTVVLSEDFSLVTDSNTTDLTNPSNFQLDTYTHVSGWNGSKVYQSTEKLKVGTSSALGYLTTPPLDLSGNNGQFVLTFDASRWSGDKNKLYVFVDDVQYEVEGLDVHPSLNTFTLSLSGGTANTVIKFQGQEANRSRFFIDNIQVVSQETGPDTLPPFVASVTPSESSVAVNFNEPLDATSAQTVANYSLDNNITVTSATLNGRVVTLAVTPDLVEGNTYTLVVNNVADASGNAMTAADTVVFTYGVSPEFRCATIAELRTKLDYSDVTANTSSNIEYKLTGEVVVTAVAAYNHQKVIQDETGAVLIYDPGDNLGALEVGDKVKDIYGTLTNYYGYLEFKPTQAYGERVGMFEDVEPLVVTLSQLNDQAFMVQHQAELIKLKDVSFTSQGQFATLSTYEITQNGVTASAVYPYFQDANTIGQDIPTGVVNITGFNFATSKIGNTYPDYRYYIVPRSMNDFTTGIHNYMSENEVTIAPNPAADYVNVTVKNDNFKMNKLYVVDMSGRVINAMDVDGNDVVLNVSDLASGCYFIRITDGKSNVTTKLIKK